MALWGTDETQDESKPTWQKDRDPTGSKGRPAINEERNTFATAKGWVRRIVKGDRTIEEVLVATNKSASPAVNDLPTRLGAANVTSVQFRDTSIAANSIGYIDISANIVIDVSFNETVDFNQVGAGAPRLLFANSTRNLNATAYPAQWDGISASWSGTQNGTNMATFMLPVGKTTTGNGEFKITASTLWIDGGTITDNVGSTASILTLAGTRKDSTAGGGGTTPVKSTVNCFVLGTVDGV